MIFTLLPLRSWLFAPLALLGTIALAAPSTELRCSGEDGANAPGLVTQATGGHRLFVCALHGKKRKGHLEIKGGFRVFALGKRGKKHEVFSSHPDAARHTAAKKGNELKIAELLWDGKENVPAFETTIGCDAKACHASSPAACVFQKPKPGSRRALEQLQDYQHGKKQGKVPEKALIDSLAALAYSGDEDAQAIFLDRGTLSLDGAVSDAYFDHQAALERLRKADCL